MAKLKSLKGEQSPKAAVVKKEKAQKEVKEKMSPEDLKAMRVANLKKREKDPKLAEVEKVMIAGIDELFKKNKALGSAQIFEAVKADIEKIDEKFGDKNFAGKKIRALLRNHYKCDRSKVETGTNKLYSLPA